MAISSQNWVISTEDPSAWYLDFYFETDEGETYTWSYFGSGRQKTYVEYVPRHYLLLEFEPSYWHTYEKVINFG